jgi:hypothetical protein
MSVTPRARSSQERVVTGGCVLASAIAALVGLRRIVTELVEAIMDPTMVIGIVVVALIALIAFVLRGNLGPGSDSAVMAPGPRTVLVVYLLLVGCLLVYLITKLVALDFPDAPIVPERASLPRTAPAPPAPAPPAPAPPRAAGRPAGGPAPAAAPPADTPVPIVLNVFPDSTLGSAPTLSLAVHGRNFTDKSVIRFNGWKRPTIFFDEGMISAELSPSVAAVGAVVVDVMNPGDKVSASVVVRVSRPVVPLRIFGTDVGITRETQLVMLAVLAGALGSYLHALKSLADFIGNRTLHASWFWWYMARPFMGMAMALIFYALLRGGFLAGTPSDAKVVSAFGVIAIGALVGMFTDKAAQKLAEVFDTLFKSEDQRTGKLAALAFANTAVPDAKVGTLYNASLTASGGKPPYHWALEPGAPPWLSIDPQTGKLTGTPTTAGPVTPKVTVTDAAKASETKTLSLNVTT